MLLDVIAVSILVVFAALGAWRGVIASGAGVVSLIAAYSAALLATSRGGALAQRVLDVPDVLAPVVAGSIAFAATYLLCAIATALLKRWDRARLAESTRTIGDRIGGALFGSLRGALVVILLSILATWIDAARDMGVLDGFGAAPDVEHSRVSGATSALVATAVESAMSESGAEAPPEARVMARIAASPGTTLESLQGLLEDDRVRGLQEDKFFWVLVENGAGERATNQASFYRLLHDPEIRRMLAELGFVHADAVDDPELFRVEMERMLSELGPRIKGLRNDPEMQALARNPEIIAMLESGNTIGLVTHPDFRRVVARVSARPSD